MRYFILYIGLIFLSFQEIYSQDSGDFFKQIDSLKKSPESFDNNKSLGILYKKTGNYQKAIVYLKKAQKEKSDPEIEKHLASVWISKGYPEKAVITLEKIIKKDSSDLYSKFVLAKLYSALHYNQKGIQILNELEQKDPTNAWYSYQKAKLLNEDINQKLDTYLAAYRKDTTWIKPIYAIAQVYNKIKFYDSARYFINKGLLLRPTHSGLLKMKVLENYRQKNINEMYKTLLYMDSLKKLPFFTAKMLGLNQYLLKNYSESLKYLNKARKMEPKDPVIYLYKSYVYSAQKKYDKAELMLHMAINYKKIALDTEYNQLGLIAKERKQYKRAIQYFYKAYKENNKNTEALFQWALTSDLFFKDKKIALKRYEKYLKSNRYKNPEQNMFAQERAYELKNELFMKPEK